MMLEIFTDKSDCLLVLQTVASSNIEVSLKVSPSVVQSKMENVSVSILTKNGKYMIETH
jgi:hypothetical protein